jgi:hypothetical protein
MVTDEELEQARCDGAFRRQLIASHLDRLLVALARLRASADHTDPVQAGHLREGVQMAVRLADMLQRAGGRPNVA